MSEKSAGQTSAETIASNQDLLQEILVRLPVKSVLKSKLVSKSWLSLLSDPRLAVKHTRLHVNLGPSGLYFYGSPHGFLNFDTNPNNVKIEIFSSETKAWELCGVPFEAPHYTDFEHAVFWNGSIHWLSPTDVSLYFDVETETLKTMTMPRNQAGTNGFWSSQRFPYLGESRGHLHLIEVDSISTPTFCVFEMKPHHSGWFVKYIVNLENIALNFPEIGRRYIDEFPNLAQNNEEDFRVQYYAYSVLSVVRGEEEDDVELVLLIPGKIVSYNPKLNTSKLLSSWRANNVYDCMKYRWYQIAKSFDSTSAFFINSLGLYNTSLLSPLITSLSSANSSMASSSDPWIKEYNEAVKIADDINGMISERSSLPASGPETQRHASAIRRKITILGTRLDGLQSLLSRPTGKPLTEKEMNRRKDMVANLRSKANQMASAFNMSNFANRDSLLGPEIKPDAMSRTVGLDNSGLVGLQRQIMKEQDEGLEKLEETVISTKHIALAVNEELDLHTRLIDDLDQHVDVTDSRLRRVQKNLAILNKRTKGGCSCMCMLLAVIGIVILVVAIYLLIKYL
ncbi:hypothetical protein COLO4_09747 [Corchorus olitorius]|uniref:t-SNARE coiled-coil homology domain-containing protein n=1 Tax=Corchorus olitorius TaxID=93759 RepID=A0A1R3KB65_9ROSI|nr:hypothetical protein COLO4_09747 [Corchorus olitorius]